MSATSKQAVTCLLTALTLFAAAMSAVAETTRSSRNARASSRSRHHDNAYHSPSD